MSDELDRAIDRLADRLMVALVEIADEVGDPSVASELVDVGRVAVTAEFTLREDVLAAVAPTAAEIEAAEWWTKNGGGTITDNTFSRQLLPEPRQHLRALVGFVDRVRALVEGETE